MLAGTRQCGVTSMRVDLIHFVLVNAPRAHAHYVPKPRGSMVFANAASAVWAVLMCSMTMGMLGLIIWKFVDGIYAIVPGLNNWKPFPASWYVPPIIHAPPIYDGERKAAHDYMRSYYATSVGLNGGRNGMGGERQPIVAGRGKNEPIVFATPDGAPIIPTDLYTFVQFPRVGNLSTMRWLVRRRPGRGTQFCWASLPDEKIVMDRATAERYSAMAGFENAFLVPADATAKRVVAAELERSRMMDVQEFEFDLSSLRDSVDEVSTDYAGVPPEELSRYAQ